MARRILIAPNSYKGTLNAVDAAQQIAQTLTTQHPDWVADLCPIADGGDGTLSVLCFSDSAFEKNTLTVNGPLPGDTVISDYLFHPAKKMLVIEAAQAHGLAILEGKQNSQTALDATSYGVGQLVAKCADTHPDLNAIVVSVGGSASTDGGVGALQALGVAFYDAKDTLIETPIGGGLLDQIARIQWTPAKLPPVVIATDVLNPLLGESGTANIFAPQKGASPSDCTQLEKNLAHVSRLLSETTGEDKTAYPGAGAAGGLAYGLSHLPGARIVSGMQWMGEQLDLEARIADCDALITGEGRFDATSLNGKATGVLMAMAQGKPVMLLCGSHDASLAELSRNNVVIADFESVMPAKEAIKNPAAALEKALLKFSGQLFGNG